MTTLKQTRVDLAGLMKVFGEHLYSTPNVAIRELVQNAHDSCVRRRVEDGSHSDPQITLEVDHDAATLSIEDTGAGLTADEIERYLATVGTGYTRELRQQETAKDGLIGYFGLGFLTAFVVAERTEVWTCSYQEPDAAWQFSSRTGQSYTISAAPPRPVGTKVTLHLSPRFSELARPKTVNTLLQRYCCLLEVPVRLGSRPAVNELAPPWRDGTWAHQRSIEFARRFEPGFEPICTLRIEPTSEHQSDVRGMMWIHDAATYGTSDNRNVSVFVRGMLINGDERDLLPAWAGFVGAVIESDNLAPTASRESLQTGSEYESAQAVIRDALISELARIARDQPAAWRRILRRHNEGLLGAALSDHRLFDLLADELTVPTTQGDLTVAAILDRSKERIHVSQAERGGFEEILFRALKVPVVVGVRYGALPFCRAYSEALRGRVVMVGTETGDREMFARVEASPTSQYLDHLNEWFGAEGVEVVATRFEPDYLPFVLVPDRDVQLKKRIESDDADRRIASAVLGLARGFTSEIDDGAEVRLYVNLACPVIAGLVDHPNPQDSSVRRVVRLLRPVLSMLSETGDQDKILPIDLALREFCETLCELLER